MSSDTVHLTDPVDATSMLSAENVRMILTSNNTEGDVGVAVLRKRSRQPKAQSQKFLQITEIFTHVFVILNTVFNTASCTQRLQNKNEP